MGEGGNKNGQKNSDVFYVIIYVFLFLYLFCGEYKLDWNDALDLECQVTKAKLRHIHRITMA